MRTLSAERVYGESEDFPERGRIMPTYEEVEICFEVCLEVRG